MGGEGHNFVTHQMQGTLIYIADLTIEVWHKENITLLIHFGICL